MSRVRDVDVGAGTVVVEVHGVGGADGQVVGASMGKDVEVCPGLPVFVPWRTWCRA